MRRVFRLPSTRSRRVREVDDELRFHLETRVEQLIARGMPPDEARREALRQFGDVELIRQSCTTLDEERERGMRRTHIRSEIVQDLSFALRTLRRNAGFTALVVGSLGIGIGADTAIFSLIDAVLLRTLPVADPARLVVIGDATRVNGFSTGSPRTDLLSEPIYRDVSDQNQVFSGVLASGKSGRLDVRVGAASGEFEHPLGRFVSGNYFSVLGVGAVAGRTFDARADSLGPASPVVTISHGYWTRRFHNDRAVVGAEVLINGVKMVIVGVAPPSFTGEIVGQSPDIWLPLGMHDVLQPHARALGDRTTNWLLLIGRLKPNATLALAQQQVPTVIQRSVVTNAVNPGVVKDFLVGKPKYYVTEGAKGLSRVRTTFHAPLITLMAGVALLLCIICGNVATLLLARAAARRREMSVRLALGAGRARLLRQLLTESATLAGLGVALGLLIARLGSAALLALASPHGSITLGLGLDAPVLTFAIVCSVLAVLLFGLVPAWRSSRVDVASTIRASTAAITGSTMGVGGRRAPLGGMLIAGQVALCVVLLVGAAILSRSLRSLEGRDVGLDRDHLIIVDVDAATGGYQGARLATLVHTVRDRLAALPGVAAVAYSENGVFSGSDSQTMIQVPGFEARSVADSSVSYDLVSPSYVHAIGGRLLAGRDLEAADEAKAPRVVVVNESLAKLYFPRGDAIGKYLYFGPTMPVRIIGVMADARDHNLTGPLPKRAYFPYVHTDTGGPELDQPSRLRFEVRTTGDPSKLVQEIRRTVLAVDSSLPIDGLDPLATLMRDSIVEARLVTQLASGFGLFALALATIGLYGVMSYSVSRRTSELGVRVALGARRGDVVRMMLVDALRLVAIGIVVGLPLAIGMMRLLRAQLPGVGTADPASVSIAVAVLAAAGALAALAPALRAARVSPIVALRAD